MMLRDMGCEGLNLGWPCVNPAVLSLRPLTYFCFVIKIDKIDKLPCPSRYQLGIFNIVDGSEIRIYGIVGGSYIAEVMKYYFSDLSLF